MSPVIINLYSYLAHRSGLRALPYLARLRRSVNEAAPCLVTKSPKGVGSLIRRTDDIRSSSRAWRECSFNLSHFRISRGTTAAIAPRIVFVRALKSRRPALGVIGISLRHLIAFRGNPSAGEWRRAFSVLRDFLLLIPWDGCWMGSKETAFRSLFRR